MKAQLTFNLDDPEDQMAHMRCVKATDIALALWEITHNLRKTIENKIDFEYNKGNKVDADWALNAVLDEIYKEMEEYNIDTEELVR